MDRIISLLAALVGLIALGGAILVHVNGDAQRGELAAEIAGLKATIGSPATAPAPQTLATVAPSSSSQVAAAQISSSPQVAVATASSIAPDTTAQLTAQLTALESRIAELERINTEQSSELADARARLAETSSAAAEPASDIAMAEVSAPAPLTPPTASATTASASAPSSSAPASSAPASAPSDTAEADCIPIGTRFMGKTGDSFPICKTKAVVKVAAVNDGSALIDGAGPVAAGSFADLAVKGCTVMVFSADTTGYAEMRVTCQ